MKTFLHKPCLLTAIFISLTISSFTQPSLDWASSFAPIWVTTSINGTANNINGTGITCNVSLTLSPDASYTYANAVSGAMSPTVTGATAIVPGSSQRLQIGVDFRTKINTCTATFNFTSLVTGIFFRIADIDKASPTSTDHLDKVIITGSDGRTTYSPVITRYDETDPEFIIVKDNMAYANPVSGKGGEAASDNSDQRGTINVDFGATAINSITITYTNHDDVDNNPGRQFIAIGNVLFTQTSLPVSLTAFSGHRQSQDIVLNWTTQQETNAASYIIERSVNNSGNWEAIGNIAARGMTTTSDYTYTDRAPQGSVLYYRLKQTDIDNHFKYSTIIRIVKDGVTKMESYPNPFTAQLNISVRSSSNQLATTTVVDQRGATVLSSTKNLFAGDNNFTLSGLDDLTSGIYYVQIKDAHGTLLGTSKVIRN